MGSCVSISVNIPLEQLFTVCCSQEEKKTITDLQNDWARLKAVRDDISRTIEESPEMRPLEIVNQWLGRVAEVENQVEKLLADYAQESANKCFCGYCPRKCKKSYTLWKQIAPVDKEVLVLHSQVPEVVVERRHVVIALQVPTESTTGMQLMIDIVWSHVVDEQDRHAGLIGLYGMGGVGKTTLLKAVHNKLCSSTQIFDLQLWIVVSKSPNLVNIQNDIGEKVGLHSDYWKIKSQDEKARDIYNVFGKRKFILLLDDIWERFDLAKIGIPLPDLQNKSKIIFTTRSKKVCGEMRATRIQVQCLKDEEAWNLFKENVGEDALNAHHDIPSLAKEVMKECSGLPLALIVIGRAMTCAETIQEWEHAIQVLKRYAADFSTMTDEVYTPLKFSYDSLTNDAIRSCFLYCSLYAEDEEILKSDLVDKWICEDYLGTSNVLRDARNKGYSHISTLVHASLLEECSSERVKMHDVIRDMALWIGGDGFYVQARAGLTQVPNDVNWKHVEKLSLMNNSIGEFNGPTEFTRRSDRQNKFDKLSTALLRNGGLFSINNGFFNLVPYLKVLDLSYNDYLWNLSNEFSELVFLQYLNLEGTDIKELPNELQKLVKLKYLNVLNTQVRTIPEGVLLCMKELSVFRCGGYHDDFLGENLVKELEGLKFLQDVTIPARSEYHISNLKSSTKLLNCITSLHLIGLNENKWSEPGLDILFLKEMKHLQDLHIESVNEIKKIEVGERQGLETSMMNNRNGGFNTIRFLQLRHCHGLKNLSWLVFCPNVERLQVTFCHSMETLIGDENEYRLRNGVEPFAKLQSLRLGWLSNLESICVTSFSFPCLNSLFVDLGVDKVRKLPFNSNSCDRGRGIVIKGSNEWWNELQWEDEATRTTFSSCFQSMDG